MNPNWKDKLRYQFDNYMSKGTGALIGGLGILSLIIVAVMAAIVSLVGISPADGEPISFIEAAWLSMMRTLDAGTMGADEGWKFRIAMFVVTIGGVFVISTLIGVLTSGIEGKMEDLRKGRSRVVEKDHTVVLGWSSQVFTIISELVIANESLPSSCIVILGNKDKVEMEDEIRAVVTDSGKTRIVCRTGNPIDMNDLDLVSLDTARSVIILSQESDSPDAETIKAMLAVTNNPKRRPEPYHIVAEIHDPKNFEVAKMVGRDEVELIQTSNLISRIIAQTCRQSGLSVVYTELLDFGGDEIYFKGEPTLEGKTFKQVLPAYEDSAILGIMSKTTGVQLNPPMETSLQAGDQLVAISEDDTTIRLTQDKVAKVQEDLIVNRTLGKIKPERTLILGWNWRAPSIINELDQYVAKGSTVTVVADYPDGKGELDRLCVGLKNEKVTFHEADTTDRRELDEIKPVTFDHVIVLSYSGMMEPQEADARTLMTLLHLRDIADKSGKDLSIVSEMLDVQNRTLAEVTRADDFIVSDRIVSLLVTQVSENKHLNAVFTDIFDPEGSEVYLKPIDNYVKLGVPVNFYTVIESASRRGEVAFGYRIKAKSGNAEESYGVVVNPDKSKPVIFSEGDGVILLAES